MRRQPDLGLERFLHQGLEHQRRAAALYGKVAPTLPLYSSLTRLTPEARL